MYEELGEDPIQSRIVRAKLTCPPNSNVFLCEVAVEGETPADFLLNCIASATCQVYQDNILKIPEVSTNSAKQLHVDIGN